MQPELACLIMNMTQGNSSRDVLLPPVPSFPTQSPTSFIGATSSYHQTSLAAGRSLLDSNMGSLNKAGQSPHLDVTHISSATQHAVCNAPRLESQHTSIYSIRKNTLKAFQAYQEHQHVTTQASNVTYVRDTTQEALNQAQNLQPQPSQTSTAQYWISQNLCTHLPPANADREPEVISPKDINILPPAG